MRDCFNVSYNFSCFTCRKSAKNTIVIIIKKRGVKLKTGLKKAFSVVLAAIIVILSATSAFALDRRKAYNWYCVHRDDGKQPQCEAEMSFLSEHGGYYIDAGHSDPDSEDKVIYLTFDAGYENGNVAKILDVMKEEQVTGAFFILENLVKQNGDLVKRMSDEGHTVCNHTATHKDITKFGDIAAFAAELKRLEDVCLEYTGVTVAKYFRPPEGRFSAESLDNASELGYSTILWSFAYADWDNNKQMSPEKAIEKVMRGTHNGEVILLHPTSATNAAIIGELIKRWKEMGFRFGSLDELTGR